MHLKKTLLAALLVAAPFATMAAAPASSGHLEVYYNDADLDVDSVGASDSGDGFGVRGQGKISDQAFIFGEYQKNEYDDSEAEVQYLRGGLGFVLSSSSEVELTGKVQVVNVDVSGPGGSADDTGFGGHVGIAFLPAPALRLFGEIGYIDAGDMGDGLEWTVGGAFSVSDQLALIADYRVSALEDDTNTEVELSDLQLGVRFNF